MSEHWHQENYIKAYRFAAQAHIGQIVPGTDLPYIMHLSFVSMEVIAALEAEPERDGDLAVQCALLHDVLEDTNVPYRELESVFGNRVAKGVLALTKDPALEKPERMQDSLNRIRQQPYEVWMVKLADRITNLQPPPEDWSKEKIRSYWEEAQVIYAALSPASRFLADRLREKIEAYKNFLS